MIESKSNDHLEKFKESFKNVSFPQIFKWSFNNLKKYTKNGDCSGIDELSKTI